MSSLPADSCEYSDTDDSSVVHADERDSVELRSTRSSEPSLGRRQTSVPGFLSRTCPRFTFVSRGEIGARILGPALKRFPSVFAGRSAYVNDILVVRISREPAPLSSRAHARGSAVSDDSDDEAAFVCLENNQLPAETILRMGNFSSVYHANDPAEAIRVLAISSFDLMIADVAEGCDDLVAQFLADARKLALVIPRVLLATWEQDTAVLERLVESGCFDYVIKPYVSAVLCNRVRGLAPIEMLTHARKASLAAHQHRMGLVVQPVARSVERAKNSTLRWKLSLLERERERARTLETENFSLVSSMSLTAPTSALQSVLERMKELSMGLMTPAEVQAELQELLVQVTAAEQRSPESGDSRSSSASFPLGPDGVGVRTGSAVGPPVVELMPAARVATAAVASAASASGAGSSGSGKSTLASATRLGVDALPGPSASTHEQAQPQPIAGVRARAVARLNSHSRWVLEEYSSLAQARAEPLLLAKSGWHLLAQRTTLQQLDFSCIDTPTADLMEVAVAMFVELDLLREFAIEMPKLRAFVTALAALYRDNPYHNFAHAVDVMQATFLFLTTGRVAESISRLDSLCLLIAALGHDLNHPGRNNQFLVSTNTQLAMLYNDMSVLENHHCSMLFHVLSADSTNLLAGLTREQWTTARATIVAVILSTDMAKHFDLVAKFQALVASKSLAEFDAKDDRRLLLSIVLHGADVSNPIRPLSIFRKWATVVQREFFLQGDEERAKGMPVTDIMNREEGSLPALEVGFIRFVVRPLFAEVVKVLPDLADAILANIEVNLRFWEKSLEFDELSAS